MPHKNYLSLLVCLFLLFCGMSYADVIYISRDNLSVNSLTLNASGDIHVTDNILPRLSADSSNILVRTGYDGVFAFTASDKKRLLVSEYLQGKLNISIYDPEDLSVPLASKELSSADISRIDSYATDENHVLIAGIKPIQRSLILPQANEAVIITIDPETCSIIGEPYRHSSTRGSVVSVYIAAHEGSVYALYNLYDGTVGGSPLYEASVRNGSNIKTFSSPVHLDPFTSNEGSIYVSSNNPYDNYGSINPDLVTPSSHQGIYRLNHAQILSASSSDSSLPLMNYAEKVVDDITDTICPDGHGGLYYLVYDYGSRTDGYYGYRRYIGHWDGSMAKRIYDAKSRTESGTVSMNSLYYDVNSRTLFVSLNSVLAAMREDENGQFTEIGQLSGISSANNAITIIGEPPAVSTDVVHEPESRDITTDSNDIDGMESDDNKGEVFGDIPTESGDNRASEGSSDSGGSSGCNAYAGTLASVACMIFIFLKKK